MGKSKTKKPKQATEASPLSPLGDIADDLNGSVKAIDGHNTTGWNDSEIKAYNELIVERQKLERQRHELEEKCAKSQTQRALLHENVANIDTLFKPQKGSLTTTKFTGTNICCVDSDFHANCHHEICKRAKTQGVTDNELDTIKYYSMRVAAEKSDRVRSALRKQRDLELVRLKKEEEESIAQNIKKSSKLSKSTYGDINKPGRRGSSSRSNDMTRAAKETEKIVNKIINQLDDLRSDLQTGRISAEEAQGKLNILDSKLPAMQDKVMPLPGLEGSIPSMTNKDVKATTVSFQNHLRDRLLNAKGDTFSQAFSIMDHFLSATKPDDLQEAITELKDVLQLSGPMCDELQNSLGALEGIFDSPDKLSFTGPDGKQECTSIIDLMEKLKDTLSRTGSLPDGANASLTKVFQECIDLEADAKQQLINKCEETTVTSSGLPAALAQIKEEFVAKSPIPPLTSNKLDIDIANVIDEYDARQLLTRSQSGAQSTELEAYITSLVILRTQKKSIKFVLQLERLDLACRNAREQEGIDGLTRAIANVMEKMKKFVPTSNTKETKVAKVNGQSTASPDSSPAALKESSAKLSNDTHTTSTSQHTCCSSSKSGSSQIEMSKEIISTIQDGGKHAYRAMFDAYCQSVYMETDVIMLDKAESYKSRARTWIEDQAFGLKDAVVKLYKLKLCPGMVVAVVSRALLEIAEHSEDNVREYMKELAGSIATLPPFIGADWRASFEHLVLATIQLYVASYVEAIASFPKISPLYIAVTIIETMTNNVLLTRAPKVSFENLKILNGFISICFSHGLNMRHESMHVVMHHYRHFCVTDKFKCLATSNCSKHMDFARIPFVTNAREIKNHPKITAPVVAESDDMLYYANGTIVDAPQQPKPIIPRKTVVTYPKNFQPASRTKTFLHNERRENEATAWHHTVLRKCLVEHEKPIETYEIRGLPPVEMVLTAIDDFCDAYVSNYASSDPVISGSTNDGDSTRSKFHELIEESQQLNDIPNRSLVVMKSFFRYMRRKTLNEEYESKFVRGMRDRAMSGRHPEPCEAVAQYLNALEAIGEIPRAMERVFIRTLKHVEILTMEPESQILFETRRLKYLLKTIGVDEPNTKAIFDLVNGFTQILDEYHEIIVDRFEPDAALGVKLDELLGIIKRLSRKGELYLDSPSLTEYVEHIVKDWSSRPSVITYFYRAENGNWVQTIAEDSAERYIGEEQLWHSVALPVEAIASDLEDVPEEEQYDIKTNAADIVFAKLRNSGLSNNLHAIVHAGAPDPFGTTMTFYKEPSASTNANHQIDGLQVKSKASEDSDDSQLEQGRIVPSAPAEIGSKTAQTGEPNNLQPDERTVDNDPNSSPVDGDTESTSTSFRMLDMRKQVCALQRNASALAEIDLKLKSSMNDEERKTFARAIEKLNAQVIQYSDLAAQIAEWNGIEFAE